MIVVKLKGGMGNQMFQYACGRAQAERYQTELKLDLSFLLSRIQRPELTLRNYELDLYNITASIANPTDIRNLTVFVDESCLGLKRKVQKLVQQFYILFGSKHVLEKGSKFDISLIQKMKKNCYLDGYWQSEKYFENIEPIIRQEFTFNTPLPEPAISLATQIEKVEAVAIFVRRTDFLGKSVHIMLDENQILKGVDYIKKHIKSPCLYIFSDEIEWCQKNLHFDLPTFFVTEEYKGARFTDHFRLMSLCKYFIIPISSFAWWAAWLCTYSDKIILHAQNPLYPDWAAKGWLEINDNLR